MSERLKELLMHPDIEKAQKVIKVAKSAAAGIISGSSHEAQSRRDELTVSIMQVITDNQGLSLNGKSKANCKAPKVEKAQV